MRDSPKMHLFRVHCAVCFRLAEPWWQQDLHQLEVVEAGLDRMGRRNSQDTSSSGPPCYGHLNAQVPVSLLSLVILIPIKAFRVD